eukprot:scaffold118820_cov54-Phaeocystis_antarctica.AAC.1
MTVLGDPSEGSRTTCSGCVKAKLTMSASGPPLRRYGITRTENFGPSRRVVGSSERTGGSLSAPSRASCLGVGVGVGNLNSEAALKIGFAGLRPSRSKSAASSPKTGSRHGVRALNRCERSFFSHCVGAEAEAGPKPGLPSLWDELPSLDASSPSPAPPGDASTSRSSVSGEGKSLRLTSDWCRRGPP